MHIIYTHITDLKKYLWIDILKVNAQQLASRTYSMRSDKYTNSAAHIKWPVAATSGAKGARRGV